MKKSTRYFLIIVCVAAFFILAPFIILYVKGIKYDSSNEKYLSTGLLSVRTNPKSAEIFLNDELKDKTPADLRFLKPGGYNVRLHKQDYRDWTKRIEVTSGKVSWASPSVEEITLFYETPKIKTIAEGAVDFQKISSGWLYLTTNKLAIADESGKTLQISDLPKPVDKILSSSNNEFFLLSNGKNTLLYNFNTHTFKDISAIFNGASSFDFDLDNNLWLLKKNQLITVNPLSLKQTLQVKNAAAFYLQDNNPYYLQRPPNSPSANVVLLTSVGGQLTPQVIAENVPTGKTTELTVTNQKEIFILADGDLYRLNENNQKLQSGVNWWQYDPSNESLIFATGSELDFYNFHDATVQLITRSGNGFANAQLFSALGYIFYKQSNQLIAAELDTYDHQNTYNLQNLSAISKFSLDKKAETIYLLDNSTIKELKIR